TNEWTLIEYLKWIKYVRQKSGVSCRMTAERITNYERYENISHKS
ncbi:unnamed protein product, partial [marine sediment metagenome]